MPKYPLHYGGVRSWNRTVTITLSLKNAVQDLMQIAGNMSIIYVLIYSLPLR